MTLQIVLLIVSVIAIPLYIFSRPRYQYYEAEIFTLEGGFGDTFRTYMPESDGFVLRKSKKADRWQVKRRSWKKMFGEPYYTLEWRELTEPHLSFVKQTLKQGGKIILKFG